MIKIYKANTNVSINVVLASKKNLHITFAPLSNGCSTFTTSDKEIIAAMERHYNFGKLFRLESAFIDKPSGETERNVSTEGKDAACISKPAAEIKRVKVPDVATAKDYLATHCGISRTVLRSEKTVLEQAQACGIEFYGINGEE